MPVTQSTLEVARQYARAGYRVLPLYPLTYNDETGERECTCRAHAECGTSAGKHPLETVAPRGAHDASADESFIDKWPEFCNLGIVPPPTTAGIDIDDSVLAQRILDMDDAQEFCMVRTRRGVHLYVRCQPAQTQNLKAADGHHVGEIRVDNALLVLPPSRHLTGEYAWVGRSILDGVPETPGTAFEYISSIVARFGVSLVERIDPEIMAQQPSSIVEQDLPFTVDPQEHLILYQMLTGTYPTTDRSKILYQLGCEMYRAAAALGVDLPPDVAAGVIRKADSVAWHKYTTRADRDVRYWETAVKTQAEIATEVALNGTTAPSRAGSTTFSWDPVAGFTYMGGGQNPSPRRVCNFEPLIVEVQDVVGEEGDIRSDWHVKFTNVDGEIFETKLRERERAELRKHLSGVLPPTFIVGSREWGNFDEGMRWYSKDKLKYRRLYGETGWLPERDAFLLPGVGGAITATGVDTAVELANDTVLASPLLRQYGVGMMTPEPGFDAAEALRALYGMAPPQITIPLVMQAVAAPLTSLDTTKTAAILHMFSRTGSFKTSMARVVIGLYGAFDNSPLDSWTSTANSLQGMMHEYRDLPMIVDDYKRSLGRSHLAQMIALIQTYADRTARGRMTRDQRQQRKVYPRCLVISTGEDVWEGQESVMARTIVIDASRGGATSANLTKAQNASRSGALARVGYMWIEWLCQRGREQLTHDLETARVTMTTNLEHLRTAEHHARSRASLAALLAVDTLWRQFIAERVTNFAEEYRALRTTGWKEILEDVSAQAEDAQSYSPYETLRTAIVNGLMTGQAQLAPRLRGYVGVGSQLAEVIGYVDDHWVWLNEGITLGWFAQRQHRQGSDIMVSWPSLLQEGRRDHGMNRPAAPQRVMHQNQAIGMRLVGFPREDFLGDELVAQIGVSIEAVEAEDLDDVSEV